MGSGHVSTRVHAHSRRRRSATPRSFTAATGLTGATEAELARRAEITAAALALVETKEAKPSRAPRIRAPRSRAPRAPRDPVAPPRVFSLPPLPDGSPRTPSPTPAGSASADEPAPAPAVAVGKATERTPQPDPEAATGPGPATAKPGRAAWSKLTAVAAATEAAVVKSTKAIRPRPPGSAKASGAGVPLSPDPSRTAPARSSRTSVERTLPTDAEPSRAARPEPTPPTLGPTPPRAAEEGRGWRPRTTRAGAGEADRRPVGRTRAPSSPGPETKARRRWTLPLVGGKERPESGATATPGTSTGGSSRKRLRSRVTSSQQAPPKRAPSRRKPARPKTPATPEQRRRRIPVAVAAVFAVAVLATSFPLSSLLSQHNRLAAAGAQLAQVQRENRALTEQQHALDSNVAVNQQARRDYQMVGPGQTLYDVLPPSSKTGTTSPGSPTNGDPGDQPLVAPANAPDLSPQPGLPQPIPTSAAGSSAITAVKRGASASSSTGTAVPPAPSTFWGRVTDTLEFWK